MPIKDFIDAEGKPVKRYTPPYFASRLEATFEDLEIIRKHRSEYGIAIEEFSLAQKEAAKVKDFETAKGFKDVIKHFNQCRTASNIVYDYFLKDTNHNRHDYPVELESLLDYEFHAVEVNVS